MQERRSAAFMPAIIIASARQAGLPTVTKVKTGSLILSVTSPF